MYVVSCSHYSILITVISLDFIFSIIVINVTRDVAVYRCAPPCASHMVTGTSHRGDRYFTLNYLVFLFKVFDPHYKPANAFSLTIIYGGQDCTTKERKGK